MKFNVWKKTTPYLEIFLLFIFAESLLKKSNRIEQYGIKQLKMIATNKSFFNIINSICQSPNSPRLISKKKYMLLGFFFFPTVPHSS